MKIVFVAVFEEASTNWSQSRAFRENGHEVIKFNYRYIASQFGNMTRDGMLIQTVQKEKPDVVIFSKCNEIMPSVVDECNKVCKTIMWYMDPVNSQFSQSLIEKIKRCSYTYCALWDSYEKAKGIAGDKVHFLQEGFDPWANIPMEIKHKNDVTFIGALRGHRKVYHDKIKFTVISDAYHKKHSEAVSSSRINLNFTHGGTSDRTYKVLASKGFLLTEPWPNMEKDFTIDKDLVIFNDIEELEEKIDYYLEHEEERLQIAENGYNTVQKFSRLNWAKNILDKII